MKNIVYSKYSNERANQFKIRTDILQDSHGKKYVQKTALTQEAHSHINNIYMYYKLLSEEYKDSRICINKCCKLEEKLEFEYINGKTLSEELDELLSLENYMGVFNKIREYVSIIDNGMRKKNFQLTKDFIEVFGQVELSSSLEAADINNIDLIFSNIIIDDNWNVVDYEWTFNFPIPFNYIVYRAIRVYMEESPKRSKLTNLGIYKLLGITDNEIIQYNKMEVNFERYVLKEFVPLNKLYGKTIGANIDVQQVMEEQKINFFKNTVQIFYDYGKGFNEENSYKIYPLLNKDDKFAIEIDIQPNVKQVRIDPANGESIVSIESIIGYTEKYYNLDYYTNGAKLNNRVILFASDDPQIVLMNIKPKTNRIELTFKIQIISKGFAIELCKFIEDKENQIKDKENEVKDKENEVKDKENQIKNKENEIKDKENEIKNKEIKIKNKENEIIACKKKIEDLQIELKDKSERIQKYNEMPLIKRIGKQI